MKRTFTPGVSTEAEDEAPEPTGGETAASPNGASAAKGEEVGAAAAATKVTWGPEEMQRIIDEVFCNNPRPKRGGGFSAYVQWVQEIQDALPPEVWEGSPTDGAKNYKHYLYGHPKKD